ncbi:MAG: LPS assembly lipoprotein LptE [Candidatus Omnitrophica bacterium]|nr:LPS assembly lipoprotein LptE [Candidatus Omnitrophota bacterium]
MGLSLSLLFASGCAYHFFSPGQRAIYVCQIENLTQYAQMEIFLTDEVRKAIVRFPGLTLVGSASQADAIVKVRLVSGERRPIFFSPDDSKKILIASVKIAAEVEITAPGKGTASKVIEESLPLSLRRAYVEETILEEISQRLANRIVFLLR